VPNCAGAAHRSARGVALHAQQDVGEESTGFTLFASHVATNE
jgi:hypothetical protein